MSSRGTIGTSSRVPRAQIAPVLFLEKNKIYGASILSATEDGKTVYYTQLDRESVIKMIEFSN